MSASQGLGGLSLCGRALGPSLDKIVKNAAWRKHSDLVSTCKSALDRFVSISDSDPQDPLSPLVGLSLADADYVLVPLILALDSSDAKVAEPALECSFRMFSLGIVRGEIDSGSVLYRLVEGICKVTADTGDEAIELAMLRVLLVAVRSPCVLIRCDALVHVVRTCYNVYVRGLSVINQICAKSALAQMMLIVFKRVEEDSMDVRIKKISVSELLEFSDTDLKKGNYIRACQNFVDEVMDASKGVPLIIFPETNTQNAEVKVEEEKDEPGELELGEVAELGDKCGSKILEDGLALFKDLCRLSMKSSSSTQENADDHVFIRGKTLSLELLKIVMDDAGPFWSKNERLLNSMRQFLCLSLLRNCALSDMSTFQIQCSILMTLLTKFRSVLKSEIGIIFPRRVLRLLEDVPQPSFEQKMTILNMLDAISQDSHLIIDIFVNYDCDVDAPNIFERIVNGLLKTALGPAAGSTTNSTSVQDLTLQFDSVNCLVHIIKSMGAWMDKQMRVDDTYLPKNLRNITVLSNTIVGGEDGTFCDNELHPEMSAEGSDAAILEQRRAYKVELQKGISLFNRSPCKGIGFLIDKGKMGGSPEAVASFLKKASGVDGTMIGHYLGEREEFEVKVMHAYVDSFNFQLMDFGEAIRFFLNSFRLPGEAQKIMRIMEKFAERYCKCNPNSFKSADTAYILAYSVIMLNTDAHNGMVKDKMVKADFIRNNRGIDDGNDLPEEYLGALYDQIKKGEIKMGAADSSASRSELENNRLLAFDGILNLVTWKQAEEKAFIADGHLMRRIQEQIKEKSGKSESIYHAVTDVAILRFMVEVFWGPMLAAFSMTLDHSNDKLATSQCLQGFRCAVHVTAVMGMQTQRDAFVTSVAKFTHLHNAVDMKQKNVDAVKAIISIAIEDGNHLQESWEHILTCLSRIECLQLLDERASRDSSTTNSSTKRDEKLQKPIGIQSLKRKGSLQNPAVMAVVRGGAYDSATIGVNASGLVTSEQINHFISNLNLLDQIGNIELDYVFAHSQHLNSEAIVAFVRSLCKVSQSELQSQPGPRFFSLRKLVEITQDNMNRIRLVWSRIWSFVSDFFVAVGLSENLSVSIYVVDSLRQLAMKILEREELAQYNFQNEFLRPFVVLMKKSRSAEIRELIVRCISQIVLSHVNNVKSGWKSVFMVFTTAADDDRKNIVSFAFETMEKIVRDYFPYITETGTTTFTDCARCLITFTNSRFCSDVSLNAIEFLQVCALKLAEGGLVCTKDDMEDGSLISTDNSDVHDLSSLDHHGSFWIPLLTGLLKLTSDSRLAIQRSSLEVLFNILKDHGHHFSQSFWFVVFRTVVLPVYSGICDSRDDLVEDKQGSPTRYSDESIWDGETAALAVQCLLDTFISFFDVLRPQFPSVISVFTGILLKSPIEGTASTAVSALLQLTEELGSKLSEDEWTEILSALKEAGCTMLQGFMKILTTIDQIKVPGSPEIGSSVASSPDHDLKIRCLLEDDMQTVAHVVSTMTNHIALQLLIIQLVADLGKIHLRFFSPANTQIILEIFSSVASHAQQLSSNGVLREKIQTACSTLETSEPPLVHFENESYHSYLDFVVDVVTDYPSISKKTEMELELLSVCETILRAYLNCADDSKELQEGGSKMTVGYWALPMTSEKKEEQAARTSLLVSALMALRGLHKDPFGRYVPSIFPLLVDLVRREHSSEEVPSVLSNIFKSCIGPIVVEAK